MVCKLGGPNEDFRPESSGKARTCGASVLSSLRSSYGETPQTRVGEETFATEEEMQEVNEGRHKVVGYTGHIPGQQHIYAQSYGRMTGNTLGPTQDHKFSKSLLYFKDARPQGAGRG